MPVKKVLIDKANRVYQMPPSIADYIPYRKKPRLRGHQNLIDLASFGWPCSYDTLPPLNQEDLKPASSEALAELKEELASWMSATSGVKLAPDQEICVGGTITSTVHDLSTAYVDFGDVALVPSLSVPLYRQAITVCGGEAISYTVTADDGWRPSFDRIQTRLGHIARLLFLNNPHNPTGAVLGDKEIAELIWAAGRANILIINDAAYRSVSERTAPSLLALEGGKKVGLEVNSFTYQFGMPALPFGFACGSRDIIQALKTVSRLRPVSIPSYFVSFALEAVRGYPSDNLNMVRKEFRKRAADAERFLELLSLEKRSFDTIPFVWARIERRGSSVSAARALYRRYGILSTPGTAFGDGGQGYLRFSLTPGSDAFEEASSRIKKKTSLLAVSRETA
ncbi:MAG: aminotransferase class I/II-fold pyridoxal phosphate-dependent enzyme [Candidatus Zixiibacteriota bacterium]|nr:MAG: aminotransferase class I/II-fold pyridoxal phosphate-dependent enzyme [candidate division Zixibacteria bacterium]